MGGSTLKHILAFLSRSLRNFISEKNLNTEVCSCSLGETAGISLFMYLVPCSGTEHTVSVPDRIVWVPPDSERMLHAAYYFPPSTLNNNYDRL